MAEVEIYDILEDGFHTAVIFDSWKVAVFNSAVNWREENIAYMQKHDFSDEVFILLEGVCTLLLSDKLHGEIYGVLMEKGKVYNVPKGMWHSHVLGEETKVIVVENSDTTVENSPKEPLWQSVRLSDINYVTGKETAKPF